MTEIPNGHNGGDAEIKRRAERRSEALDLIAEQQELIKQFKAEDKSDGFDEKALAFVIKEMRGGPEKQAANLELAEIVDTYRRGLGLPTTFEAAQAAQRETAAVIPAGRQREDD